MHKDDFQFEVVSGYFFSLARQYHVEVHGSGYAGRYYHYQWSIFLLSVDQVQGM